MNKTTAIDLTQRKRRLLILTGLISVALIILNPPLPDKSEKRLIFARETNSNGTNLHLLNAREWPMNDEINVVIIGVLLFLPFIAMLAVAIAFYISSKCPACGYRSLVVEKPKYPRGDERRITAGCPKCGQSFHRRSGFAKWKAANKT